MKKNVSNTNLIYIIVYLLIAAIGLNNSLGISAGNFKPPIFYTSVSGLICFIYFLIAAIRGIYFTIKKESFPDSLFLFPRAKGAVTLCITVTFLIYHFIVYDGPFYTIDADIFNLITHYIVPIMVIAHWLIFDKKGIYKPVDPILWTGIPLIYFTWANIVALQHTEIPYWDGDFYPYGFMDLTLHSPFKVFTTIIILLVFFIALGYGIYGLDSKLEKNKPLQLKK